MIFPLPSLDTKHTTSGAQIDALAIAGGFEESNELDNWESVSAALNYTFEKIDHEIAAIACWNEYGHMQQFFIHFPCSLKRGACLALHAPELFAEYLREWINARRGE